MLQAIKKGQFPQSRSANAVIGDGQNRWLGRTNVVIDQNIRQN
jgi:hypothetical protein